MCGILILRFASVCISISVNLIGKHVINSRSRTSGPSVLINNRRETAGFPVVDMVRSSAWHSTSPQCGVGFCHGRIVWILCIIDMLRDHRKRETCTCQHQKVLGKFLHRFIFGWYMFSSGAKILKTSRKSK